MTLGDGKRLTKAQMEIQNKDYSEAPGCSCDLLHVEGTLLKLNKVVMVARTRAGVDGSSPRRGSGLLVPVEEMKLGTIWEAVGV